MTIKTLSILIPTYNDLCIILVDNLRQQAETAGIDYEIIVADDGSPHPEQNQAIGKFPHCTYIMKEKNEGSAATRNFLARQSRYEWLLFLDSDVSIAHINYISKYLSCEYKADVINGGIDIGGCYPDYLRWRYEKKAEPAHRASSRQTRPYRQFRSTNFMIRKKTMLQIPFDERFKNSGYEDVLFGKALEQAHVQVVHIDNPVTMTSFEDNRQFMEKTERNLRTLHHFRHELEGYSGIINGSKRPLPAFLLRTTFRLLDNVLRKNLCGRHPHLLLYNFYRMGYYLNIRT